MGSGGNARPFAFCLHLSLMCAIVPLGAIVRHPTGEKTAMRYQVYSAPGWHGKPEDPIIMETDDEHEAAMRAGERRDIKMPGGSNRYDAYAVDAETGDEVERVESYRCDVCEELTEWGDGPIGMRNGRVLDCPGAIEKHLVTWACPSCAEDEDEEEEEEIDTPEFRAATIRLVGGPRNGESVG